MRGPAQHPAQTLATTSAARPRAPPAAAASLPRRQGHQHGRVLLGSRMMRVCASGFVHTATMPPHHVSRLHEPVGSRARTEQASRACRRGRTPLTETAQPASVLNLNLLLGLQQHSTPHKPQHATARPSCRAQSAACHRPPLLLSSERGERGGAGPGPHRCCNPSTSNLRGGGEMRGRGRTGAGVLPRLLARVRPAALRPALVQAVAVHALGLGRALRLARAPAGPPAGAPAGPPACPQQQQLVAAP